jgi:endonuclease/exonuclease/phosphatase family metal-dependent hydrolase
VAESRDALRTRLERDANAWRLREAARTHSIIKEIEAQGPSDVMLVGDMNDELGMDENEKAVGQDSIATLVGPPEARLELVTRKLADGKMHSFGGYWRPRYRSLIDHVIATDSMSGKIRDVYVFTGSLAKVASDHYPVVVKVSTTQ